jgi:hypothetical protein
MIQVLLDHTQDNELVDESFLSLYYTQDNDLVDETFLSKVQ